MLDGGIEQFLMRLLDARAARAELRRQERETDVSTNPASIETTQQAPPRRLSLRWFQAKIGKLNPKKATGATAAVLPSRVQIGMTIPSQREALRTGVQAAARPVFLDTATRLKHVYLLGRTGSGKTNLLLQLILADIAEGRGACLFDKEGDLVDRVLLHIAARYAPDVMASRLVILDLRQHAPYKATDEPVVGFNPLVQSGNDPYTAALFTLEQIKEQFEGGVGVQVEQILRNALIALSMAEGNLGEIELLLTDPAFRKNVLAKVTDASVRRFFERFDALPEKEQASWISPCLNKIAPLLARPSLLRVLCQQGGGISVRNLFDQRPDTILLVCGARGELFGAADLFTNLVATAAVSAVIRADRPLSARKGEVFLYIDEFENFARSNTVFEKVIAEGRRYGLGLIASHQALGQLEPKVRSLLRNVIATQIYLQVGGTDAEQISGELPGDTPKAALRSLLIGQKVGEALLVSGGQSPVRIRTAPLSDPVVAESVVAAIRTAALAQWGRPIAQVDQDMRRFFGNPLPAPVVTSSSPPGPVPNAAAAPVSYELREVETGVESPGGTAPPPPAPKRRGAKRKENG